MPRTLWGPLLVLVVTSACASTGAVPRPFPGAPTMRTDRDRDRSADRARTPDRDPADTDDMSATPLTPTNISALIDTALALRGIPYRNGGSDPDGFDCSGFTQYVFAQHGIVLPREVREQFQEGQSVDERDLAPGDLLFFQTTGRGATHVAIVTEGDAFVHAPSSTGVVRVEHLASPYWARRFIGARRIDH